MTDKTDLQAGCFRWQELQGKLTNKAQGRTVSCQKCMRRGGDGYKSLREKMEKVFCQLGGEFPKPVLSETIGGEQSTATTAARF